MKKSKENTLLALILLLTLPAIAQQDPMFTHYMFNTLSVNPAYAGSREALTTTLLNRSQWVGFDGAPVTQNFNIHTPINRKNIGLGLSVVNDKIGPLKSTSAFIDFAYRIKSGEKSYFSFGLKGGANSMQANFNNMNLDQQNDGSFINSFNRVSPNFGFGMYYKREKFYAGISTPKLLESKFTQNVNNSSISVLQQKRHLFFITGAIFKVNDDIDFKPTSFVKVTSGAPVEADLTGTFIIEKSISAGLMYRTGDAFGLLLGYNITPQCYFGYAFDWSYKLETFRYNNGSHEIMLRYDFFYNEKQKIRSPRYF
jgi:type IX secretion system PorP/SprF family membrane protein